MKKSKRFDRSTQFKNQRTGGFTLIDLLVIIATLLVLTFLLIPALAGTRTDSVRLQCRNNLKQLQAAFQLFAQDHNDTLPPAGWANNSYQITWDSWLHRYTGGKASDSDLQVGTLVSAQGLPQLVCPADTFPKINFLGGNSPWFALRSYAMNSVGPAWGTDYQVNDQSRTYPLPDLSQNNRHGVGIYWNDTAATPDWEARGYKNSVARDPAGTILLTENTHGQQTAANIWTCVVAGPQASGANLLYQIDSNTVQQTTASQSVNQGIFLYQAQQNTFNYAFHDGHVESLSIQQTAGSGTLAAPKGMWTVTPGD